MITFDAKPFATAVASAMSVVRRQYIPVLECLRLVAADNTLRIIGTDMDTQATGALEAAVSEQFDANVSGADLLRLSRSLSGAVTLRMADRAIVLSASVGTFEIAVNPDAFPEMSANSEFAEVTVAAQDVARVVDFVDPSGFAPVSQGAHFEEDSLFAITGPRAVRFDMKGGSGQVVPGKALGMIARSLAAGGRLFLSADRWRLEQEGFTAIGKLIDAVAPPWRATATPNDPLLTFEASDALAAADLAGLGRCQWLVLSVTDGIGSFSGDRFNGPNAQTSATFRCEGDDLCLVFARTDIERALKPFKDQVVTMGANERARRFSPVESPDVWTMIGAVRDARTRLPDRKEAA